MSPKPFVKLIILALVAHVSGNYNLFVDKEEFHRITGGTLSQVYLVRDGVVNDYALGYVMTVPYHIQYLDFKWQATTKKPVHYEILIEFSDFFALLQPSANISKVGRLPHKLETLRVSLPCSGRLTTEVPVIIRFTFNVKHATKNNVHGHNVTNVNVKRNKICLLKENHQLTSSVVAITPKEKRTNAIPPLHDNFINNTHLSHPITPLDHPHAPSTTPSLLLAGLLGGCAVTASIASVVFFICLKKRLQKIDQRNNNSTDFATEKYYHPSNSTTTSSSSPACLLRNTKTWVKDQSPPSHPPPPLPNSYANIASFWNDILSAPENKSSTRLNSSLVSSQESPLHKRSDVSPYAYAQIIQPNTKNNEWWNASNNSHIYANHLSSFAGQSNKLSGEEVYDSHYAGRSVGSGSLIQIDGFQCPKNFTKEKHVEERFL
ncbi:uncharacterized protein LOC110862697 [Folsomia candida]|uniref:Tyrosine-protein kinase Drl n=1 Tax=Folsomia candida TaxID=158441 RepID=A0A226F371_FOLCA|nr:uncharacterized protein LOC110862697 [Folsomia candida]OXA63376.1 Tyrosine-protein kinase Drl [Folsomia candida]